MSKRVPIFFCLLPLLISLACQVSIPLPYNLPTLIPSATAALSFLPSLTPTQTLTPTPLIPAQAGTPFPQSSAVISPSNAVSLVEFASRGLGIASQMILSPDGRFLAAATTRGIFIYDATSLVEIKSVFSLSRVRLAAFSPDSSLLVFALSNDEIHFLRLSDLSHLDLFFHPLSPAASLAILPDNQLLAIGQINGEVSIWQIGDGKFLRTIKAHSNPVKAIAFSKDGKNLYSWADKESVKVWSAASGSFKKDIYISRDDLGENPHNGVFSSNGDFLSLNFGMQVRVYRLSNGTILRLLRAKNEPFVDTALSPDGSHLAGLTASTILVWELVGSAEPIEFSLSQDKPPVRQVALFPAGKNLASLSDTLQVRGVAEDAIPLRAKAEFLSAYTTLTSLSEDSQTLIISQIDGTLHSYRTATGEFLQTARIPLDDPSALTLSLDQKFAAAAGQAGQVVLWEIGTDSSPLTMQEKGPAVRSLGFSSDGMLLAAGSDDHTILVWNTSSNELLQTLKTETVPQMISFLPGTGGLFSSGAGSSALWDINNGKKLLSYNSYQATIASSGKVVAVALIKNGLGEIQVHQIPTGELVGYIPVKGYALALSPDGQVLAVGENTITLWNVSNGALLAELKNEGLFGRLIFSPDGRLLTLTGIDGSIRFWGVP
jgi:WD40 repeat protein